MQRIVKESMKENHQVLKLNIGCGPHSLKGFINCDIRNLPEVDRVFDLILPPYPFDDSSIEHIHSEETLEHLSFLKIPRVLKEFYRILKPEGTIFISVPDCGAMCRMYINQEVCTCVPHKAINIKDFKSKEIVHTVEVKLKSIVFVG